MSLSKTLDIIVLTFLFSSIPVFRIPPPLSLSFTFCFGSGLLAFCYWGYPSPKSYFVPAREIFFFSFKLFGGRLKWGFGYVSAPFPEERPNSAFRWDFLLARIKHVANVIDQYSRGLTLFILEGKCIS